MRLFPDAQTSCLKGFHATLNHWHPSWLGTYCRFEQLTIHGWWKWGVSDIHRIALLSVCRFIQVVREAAVYTASTYGRFMANRSQFSLHRHLTNTGCGRVTYQGSTLTVVFKSILQDSRGDAICVEFRFYDSSPAKGLSWYGLTTDEYSAVSFSEDSLSDGTEDTEEAAVLSSPVLLSSKYPTQRFSNLVTSQGCDTVSSYKPYDVSECHNYYARIVPWFGSRQKTEIIKNDMKKTFSSTKRLGNLNREDLYYLVSNKSFFSFLPVKIMHASSPKRVRAWLYIEVTSMGKCKRHVNCTIARLALPRVA